MAENVAESLQKGQRVIVTGSLKIRNFERQDGSKGTSVEINVEEVGPSLKWATAKVTKASRSGGGDFGGGQGGQQGGGDANPWSQQPAAQAGGGSAPQQGGGSDAWAGGAGGSTDEPPF
jgi:single-strand DNA-binding protein